MHSNPYFQFYITRYPFPNATNARIKLYTTYYECHGFQLSHNNLARLTGVNKLPSVIKLKQIVKNISKPKPQPTQHLTTLPTHTYSLFYQILQHFILSPFSVSYLQTLTHNPKNYHRTFQPLFQDIQTLILHQIYYLIDIQNLGITKNAQIKFYLPANFILEDVTFTEAHQIQMKATANVTVEYIMRNLQLFNNHKTLDVEFIRHQIKKQVANKIQIIPKNIESQIFTFNEKPQTLDPNQQLTTSCNQDLQKTVKIRKSSQKIQFVPAIEFSLLKHSLPRDAPNYHTRSMTSRQLAHKQQERSHTKRSSDNKKNQHRDHSAFIQSNPHKQNEFLKERMKDYEEKLQSLNNTVKQMKQELMIFSKKDTNNDNNPHSKNQPEPNTQKQKSCTNLSQINEFRQENISFMAEKLSTSRLEIKKLLHDETFLRKSYLVEEQEDQDEDPIDKHQEAILDKQIQNLMGSNQLQFMVDKQKRQDNIGKLFQNQHRNNISVEKRNPSQTKNNHAPKDNQRSQQKNPSMSKQKVSDKRPSSSLKNIKQTSPLNIKDSADSGKSNQFKVRNSFDYESSIGKYSPPGGNPFRQYGNFRIQYVIDEKQKPKDKSAQIQQKIGGHIQIHRDPSVRPYQIIRSPVKKQHFFYPVVHIREPFRYSCLAIPKVSGEDYEYIAIPENMYDPSQYDSVDTFEMELGFGQQHKMPSIVSKGAFRHTLFPSSFVQKLKTDERRKQKVSKQKDEPQKDGVFSGSIKKKPKSNIVFESAGSKTLAKQIQAHIKQQIQADGFDGFYERKSNQRLPKIREDVEAFHEISMDVQTLSKKDEPKLEKKVSEESHRSRYLFEGANHKNSKTWEDQDKQSRLSKTAREVPKVLNKEVSQQNRGAAQLKKVLCLELINQNKKPIDKEKLNAVLNKSKQIISRYKRISYKKQ